MMSTEIKIEHLGQHKVAIPVIVSWLHAEWGHLMPEISVQKLASIFEERVIPHQIPQSFVAVVDGQIVGTASLVRHDMSSRMDLTPWLASVYVAPEHRNQGIGSGLVQHVMQQAQQHNIQTMYLFTPGQEAFYTQLGWATYGHCLFQQEPVTIMRAELTG